MLSRAVLKVAPQLKGALLQSANMTTLSSPARVKVPVATKIAHAVFIIGCMYTIPVYVLVNMKNYSQK